ALDARNLHQPGDRIATHAQVMLDADLGGVLDLRVAATERGGESAGGHRTGYADLPLATDLGSGQGGVPLAQPANRGRGEQKRDDAVLVAFRIELAVVADDRRDDPGRPVGRRSDDSAAGGILLVDRDGIDADPIDRLARTLFLPL